MDSRGNRGGFEEYKRLCELGCVSLYKQKGSTILLWMVPVTVFRAFREVIYSHFI